MKSQEEIVILQMDDTQIVDPTKRWKWFLGKLSADNNVAGDTYIAQLTSAIAHCFNYIYSPYPAMVTIEKDFEYAELITNLFNQYCKKMGYLFEIKM